MKKLLLAFTLLSLFNFHTAAQDLILQEEEVTVVNTKALGHKFTLIAIPDSDLIAVQVKGLLRKQLSIEMFDKDNKLVHATSINPGSTIAHIETQTLYNGNYTLHISDNRQTSKHEILIARE